MILLAHTFVAGDAMETKKCSKCKCVKNAHEDFYRCQGNIRSDCKKCAIKHNVAYQRKAKTWMHRHVDGDEQKSYMVDYYQKNKEKFAQYRRQFKERYPDYHRNYYLSRKNDKP